MIRLPRKVLCLDWDRRYLRIVVARAGGGTMQLEDAHAHRIPESISLTDTQAFGTFIAQMLRRHHIRSRTVVLHVPRDRAVINRLTLPPTPEDEVAAAVRFQAARELPFPLDEAEIDFVVLRRDEQQRATEVLLAAVRLETLEEIQALCQAAGLTPARIGLRPWSNLIAIQHLPELLDRRVLLIDVGPAQTEIDVIDGRVLAFSRAATVAVPPLGLDAGGEDSSVSSVRVRTELELADEAYAEVVQELLVEITRTLQAYRATEGQATIDQIVIAGGTGIEPALIEAVVERFGLPTTLYDPTTALGVSSDDAVKLRSFPAVLGLAWGISREGLLEIDFLNPKRPVSKHEVLKRRLKIGGIAVGTLAVLAVSLAAADRIRTSMELARVRQENETLYRDAIRLRRIEIVAAEARDWYLESRMMVWADHLLNLTRAAIDPGKQMLATDLQCDGMQGRITLKLVCARPNVAHEFVRRLNALEVDGKRVYQAELGAWQTTDVLDPRFRGRVDVRVDLLELRKFRGETKRRKIERKKLEDI